MALYPRRVTSTPTALQIVGPGGWGSGSDVGSLIGDVWTPGRDSNGLVNLVSWNTVPTGRWIDVAGNTTYPSLLSDLNADVVANVPGWYDAGAEDWNGVLDDWVAPAVDSAGGKLWLAACGGHGGSYNNGVYEWDCYRMCWKVLHYPTHPNLFSSGYIWQGSATMCSFYLVPNGPDGRYAQYGIYAAQKEAGTAVAINGIYYDELSDGTPTSRHTYQSAQYIPQTNEIVQTCRRLWKFNLTSKTWTYKRQVDDFLPALSDGYSSAAPNSSGYVNTRLSGENQKSTYDEIAGEYLVFALGSEGGSGKAIKYNVLNDSIGWGSLTGLPTNYADLAVTARNGRTWFITAPPGYPSAPYNPQPYWIYNLDSRQVVQQGTLTQTGGLVNSNWVFADGMGMTYIPPLGVYWMNVMAKSSGGPTNGTAHKILEINPTGWTISQKTFVNEGPRAFANPSHKLVYLAALNAVVYPQTDGVSGSAWCLPMKLFRF